MMSLDDNIEPPARLNSQPSPLIKLLSMYSLSKYAEKLSKIGYSHDLRSLATLTNPQLERFYKLLGLAQEDRAHFAEMLRLIVLLTQNPSMKRSKSTERNMAERSRRMSNEGKEVYSDENLTQDIEKYNLKIEEEKQENQAKNKIVAQLEEAKRKIEEMTNKLKSQHKNVDLAKEMEEDKEIKTKIDKQREEVGFSYDSSKLRSTLAHIDVEEMCNCLSKALLKNINHAMRVQYMREQKLGESISSLPNYFEAELLKDQTEDTGIKVPHEIAEIFTNDFNDPNSRAGQSVSKSEIYYFCKNVIFRARMEKECSIICLIYIERLIRNTGLYFNERN